MKQFFEQYGGVALGILALLVLIAMITPVGNLIKTTLQGTVQTFSTKMEGQAETMTESMSAAFVNATDFTGIKDNKIYAYGSVPEAFKNYSVSNDGKYLVSDITGISYPAGFNLNCYIDGVRHPYDDHDLLFDIYINDNLAASRVGDAFIHLNIRENPKVTVKLSDSTIGYEIQDVEYKYINQLIAEEANKRNSDWIPADNLFYISWDVNVVSK